MRNSLGTPNHINGFQSNAFPYTIVFAGKKRSEEERTFLLEKDEIANPCNFSVLKKKRRKKTGTATRKVN